MKIWNREDEEIWWKFSTTPLIIEMKELELSVASNKYDNKAFLPFLSIILSNDNRLISPLLLLFHFIFFQTSWKLQIHFVVLLSLWQLEKTSRKGATSSFELLGSSKSILLPPWQQEKTSRKGATTIAVAKTSCPFLLHLILIMKKIWHQQM